MFCRELLDHARKFIELCESKELMVATVESCTGGLLAGCLTAIAGSSAVVERGYVTYSNAAKTEQVGVDAALIARHGAVSKEVAAAMAKGALDYAPVDLSVSITGVAGPGGGTAAKPVGLVYIAVATRDGAPTVRENRFDGDRTAIRDAALRGALEMLIAAAAQR